MPTGLAAQFRSFVNADAHLAKAERPVPRRKPAPQCRKTGTPVTVKAVDQTAGTPVTVKAVDQTTGNPNQPVSKKEIDLKTWIDEAFNVCLAHRIVRENNKFVLASGGQEIGLLQVIQWTAEKCRSTSPPDPEIEHAIIYALLNNDDSRIGRRAPVATEDAIPILPLAVPQ